MEELKLENVSYKYGDDFELSKINFTLCKGEITCLIGESGSGKSTLLRLISGLDIPREGTISLGDKIIFDKKNKINLPPEKRNFALIFQHLSLFPNKSILENVKFAVKDSRGAEEVALDMLKIVGMEKYADNAPQSISGGQQQLVTLARAFAQSPSLLLLDEPFSSLDAILRPYIREKIISLIKERNLTTLIVTHDPQEALEISDKIIVIRDGNIIMNDVPHNIYYYPLDIRTARLFGKINHIQTELNGNFFDSVWGKIESPKHGGFTSVCIRPEGIKFSDDINSVTGVVKKVQPFSKMLNFCVNNQEYWMKLPIELSRKKDDTINVKLDYNYLVFF